MKKLDKLDKYIDKLRIKDKDVDRKIYSEVLDVRTLKVLYKLSSKGAIKALGGVISTGKEANVFYADSIQNDDVVPAAVKIYRIETGEFRKMGEYIFGDTRFRIGKTTREELIFLWTEKEFRNLKRAYRAGASVPQPIVYLKNVIIMEFIGVDEIPAPVLSGIPDISEFADPFDLYKQIIKDVKLIYQNAGLVHADLSEYNVLLLDEKPYIIDMGQSVLKDHPHAMSYLERDIRNILRFFSKYGIKEDIDSVIELIKGKGDIDAENRDEGT